MLAQLHISVIKLDRYSKTIGFIPKNKLVIFSDHGEELGEHGVMSHTNNLYRQGVRMPLSILTPDKMNGTIRVQTRVSFRDIPVTILDLMDLDETSSFNEISNVDALSYGKSWNKFYT